MHYAKSIISFRFITFNLIPFGIDFIIQSILTYFFVWLLFPLRKLYHNTCVNLKLCVCSCVNFDTTDAILVFFTLSFLSSSRMQNSQNLLFISQKYYRHLHKQIRQSSKTSKTVLLINSSILRPAGLVLSQIIHSQESLLLPSLLSHSLTGTDPTTLFEIYIRYV